jgi:hypothetical protein
MARNQGNKNAGTRTDNERDPIEERLIRDGETDREDVLGAAQDAFVEDQKDSDHPTRVERQYGVEDPSHSKSSDRRRSG